MRSWSIDISALATAMEVHPAAVVGARAFVLIYFSGHVTMAPMPALYLTLVDHRFRPTLLIPVVMVPDRVCLEAYDWFESIVTFLVVVGVFWWQTGGELRAESDAAVS